jgi:predicted transcriptional regulator of viral defense system
MIALSMLATAGYWGWGWYDDNTVVQVTISSPIEAMTASYKVRKKDIQEQRITTIDGIQIRLSNQERLTVTSLKNE